MTSTEFNKLEYFNKILLINNYGVEIDNIFPEIDYRVYRPL